MTPRLHVVCCGTRIGELAELPTREIVFQYDQNWLAAGFSLAPKSVPFNGDPNPAVRPTFQGLHGVFNDSLPDGWGLLLMDRALKQHLNLDRDAITPLDRLAYMGHRGMGALEYQPELLPEKEAQVVDLAAIAEQAELVLHGKTLEVLEMLRICGGSPGGARPKVTVAFSEHMDACLSSFREIPSGYSHLIVKFRNDSSYGGSDPSDIGRLERAYADMACSAGLEMAESKLLELTIRKKKALCGS